MKLWPHQQKTVDFCLKNPRVLDMSDPGVGKTAAHITAFYKAKNRGRLLVVCPKTLMHAAWGKDIETFAPDLTVSYATAAQRLEAFQMKTDVVIINTDGVKWLHAGKNAKLLNGFTHLVVDEFSYFKHPTSQRSKALMALCQKFAYRALLSGTPNANTVAELWCPAYIADDGARLGTSFYKFRASVQSPKQVGPGIHHVKWQDKPGAVQATHELLAGITVRHSFEEVMKHVPPNHRDTKVFELSPRAKKTYDKMEAECILAIEDATITAIHASSLRNKLLQIASGAVYSENGKYQLIDTSRYELIADLVELRNHSVVFFNWAHQRDELSKEFTARDFSFAVIDGSTPQKERDEIVTRYQNGEYRTLLLQPKTGAHGLTLTRGGTTIISSPFYEADLLKQAIHRVYRGSQRQVTNTLFVQAKGTVEDLVYARLDEKTEQMEDLLSLMAARKKCGG